MTTSNIQAGSSIIEPVNLNANLTSIADVREILQTGIPRGKSLIYYSQPGVESETFGLEIAYHTISRGRNCIFVASNSSPDSIKSKFKECGMNIELFKDKLLFVDAYSQLTGTSSNEKYIVTAPKNIYVMTKEILRSLKESPPSTVIFGSLSTIMDLCGEKETIEAISMWNMMAKLCGHVITYNFAGWHFSYETLNSLKNDLFNSVVYVGGIAEKGVSDQYTADT